MAFVPADRLRHVKKSATRQLYDSAPAGSINLGLGEPDFQTPEPIRTEACRSIEQDQIGYTPNSGLPALREKIAAYHSEGLSTPYSASSVCITSGVAEALFDAMMAMANPGDEVLLPDPCYIAYPVLAEIAGARSVFYEMPAARRFGFDLTSFERSLSDKTKVVFIASPSNPTGQVMSSGDLRSVAGLLAGSNIWIVTDEIYRELYYGERPHSISEYYPNTIVLSGLSKMMSMTGWRLGWAVGPEEVIRQITLMHQYVSTCASAVSQKAALAAFTSEGRGATALMREELGRRRDVMVGAIERELGLPYVAGEGAFYVMLDISQFGPSDKVAWALLVSKVITVPGGAFGSQGEGYLRLSFSTGGAQIEEGIRRIASGLKGYHTSME
jgi:aspartate/methionine/tyrosine aminotransferase